MDFVKLDMSAQVALADGFGLLIDDGVFADPSQLADAVGMTMDDLLDLWSATDERISYPVSRGAILKFTKLANRVHAAETGTSTLVMMTPFGASLPTASAANMSLQ